MMQPNDFRSRARTLRLVARQQLLKLREERMTHKVPRLAAAHGTVDEAPAIPEAEAFEAGLPLADAAEDFVAEVTDLSVPESGMEEVAPPPPEPVVVEPPAPAEAAASKPKTPRRKADKPAEKQPARQTKALNRAPRAVKAEAPEDHSIRRAALAEMFENAAPEDMPEPQLEPSFPQSEALVQEPEPVDLSTEAVEVAAAEPVSVDEAPTNQVEDLHLLPGAGPGLIWMLQQCGIVNLTDLAACDVNELTRKLGLVGQILDVSVWRDFATGRSGALQQAS